MGTTRAAAVAGTFYASDPGELEATVRRHLERAAVPETGLVVRALIVPHAGHIYSGPVAAAAYRLLPADVGTVALMGPSHFVGFDGVALSPDDGFATPLGIVPVDVAVGRACRTGAVAQVDRRPHAREHCLEVQVPFLQCVPGTTGIVPMLTGDVAASAAADVLECALDAGAFLVISSDLSHYLPHDEAVRRDRTTAHAITGLRWGDLDWGDACGRVAIQAVLVLAGRRGWRCELLDLRTSADTAGSPDRVVGYGAFALGPPAAEDSG